MANADKLKAPHNSKCTSSAHVHDIYIREGQEAYGHPLTLMITYTDMVSGEKVTLDTTWTCTKIDRIPDDLDSETDS